MSHGLIQGVGPLAGAYLRLDLVWNTDLDIQHEDFFGGAPFALEGVPVHTLSMDRDPDQTVLSMKTHADKLVESKLENFEYDIRKAIARSVPGTGVAAQETEQVVISSWVQGKGPAALPRPLQDAKPIVHVQIMGSERPDVGVLTDAARNATGERVDVVPAGAGYNFIFPSDFVTWEQGVDVKMAVDNLLDTVRDPTLVFHADRGVAHDSQRGQ